MFTVCFGTQLGWVGVVGSTLVFLLGLLTFLSGCFDIRRGCKVVPRWDDRLLENALRSAQPEATIRILQTWFPNRDAFCALLEELLTRRGKQFCFEILLMNTEKAENDFDDLLAARVLHRAETRSDAHHEIVLTVKRLMKMKQRVDREWGKKHPGRELALDIRCYKFMPFGPIYQVAQDRLFVGLYLNFESSTHTLMFVIQDHRSRVWEIFQDDFEIGWQDGKKVVGVDRDSQLIFED